jgi:hypothetical protein
MEPVSTRPRVEFLNIARTLGQGRFRLSTNRPSSFRTIMYAEQVTGGGQIKTMMSELCWAKRESKRRCINQPDAQIQPWTVL